MKKISARETQFLGSLLLVLLLGIVVVFSQIEEKKQIGEPENETTKVEFPLDLNSVSEKELEFLPGIGPTRAHAIIDYRNSVGEFKAIEDLLSVKGIGEKTLDGFCELITVVTKKGLSVDKTEFPNLININSASIEQLCTLPGIGDVKARSIIEYRRHNGVFKKTDELINVSGIGDSTLNKIRGSITIGEISAMKDEANENSKINVNRSSKEQLTALPGIGEVISTRIVAYREEYGSFKNKDDLLEVKGIGTKILEQIQELIEF